MKKNISIPHPFPYQGSKRKIAPEILNYFPDDVQCLIEPFCGAAAVSIAAAVQNLAESFYLNDLNQALMKLWQEILERPSRLSAKYERLWIEQQDDKKEFFFKIRDEFNRTEKTDHLLYLLARIVKGSIRYNGDGIFNQSADNRRTGMRPKNMKMQILGVSALLQGKTRVSAKDFREALTSAQRQDLVYMDPPYQGTSFTRDHRYYSGISFDEFVSALESLNKAGVSYIISYDGQTGDKSYGRRLPESLALKHLFIHAGRSTQATLLGKSQDTIESLYLSSSLVERLESKKYSKNWSVRLQQELAFV